MVPVEPEYWHKTKPMLQGNTQNTDEPIVDMGGNGEDSYETTTAIIFNLGEESRSWIEKTIDCFKDAFVKDVTEDAYDKIQKYVKNMSDDEMMMFAKSINESYIAFKNMFRDEQSKFLISMFIWQRLKYGNNSLIMYWGQNDLMLSYLDNIIETITNVSNIYFVPDGDYFTLDIYKQMTEIMEIFGGGFLWDNLTKFQGGMPHIDSEFFVNIFCLSYVVNNR